MLHSRIYQFNYNKNKLKEYFHQYHIGIESLILQSNLVLPNLVSCLFYFSLSDDPLLKELFLHCYCYTVVASETSGSCQKSVTSKITARYYIEDQVKKC